ncbi:MAG: hypothetical protein JNK67_18335 [Alphaproteobacteria bacterium]|nr:hypothetical protein [Alphaproteobacteria bacterium]
MQIDGNFDGGNIEVRDATDPAAIRLAIRPDRYSHYFQWFAFRVVGARGKPCRFILENAAESGYPAGWSGYRAVGAHDARSWRRLDTHYADGRLVITATPDSDVFWIAYFGLYTEADHAAFLARTLRDERARLRVLGSTLDGRSMDLLTIGTPGNGKRNIWVIARQHSGETMASWFVDGFVARLLDRSDAVAQDLLRRCVFHVVPNMNPDGSRRGHLRCNAAGVDLNREWATPRPGRSPEVFLVRARMLETGVDGFLDVHGDEVCPHNFLIGSQGIPNQTPAMSAMFDAYRAALVTASPDYHPHNGNWQPDPPPGNLTIGSRWVANRFGCLAITIEMPFQDETDTPDAAAGWSPARSEAFGRAHLDALAAVVPTLR